MERAYQELVSVLGKELALFKELRSLLDQETKPLIEMDTKAIEANVKAKQTLELRLKILEQSRLQIVSQMAQALRIDPADATLKNLARFAPNGQRERLVRAREAFIRLTGEIQEKVEKNGQLVQSSLRVVQGLQQVIANALEEPATYEDAGKLRKSNTRPRRESRRI